MSVFWFGSFDEIDSRDDNEAVTDGSGNVVGQTAAKFYPVFRTEFHRLDLRYDHDTASGHLRLAATLGIEDSLAGSSETQQTSVVARSAQLRSEGEERLNADAKLRYGADVLLYHYSIDTGQSSALDLRSLYPHRNDVMIGAYADTVWKAAPRVEVVPGFRVDLFTSRLASPSQATVPSNDMTVAFPGALTSATAALGLEPRLATRVVASRAVTWVTTFGVSHQPPSLFVPIPGLTLGRLDTGLQTSIQTSQGIELALPADITVTGTAFLHDYLGLTDATATCLNGGSLGNLPDASNDCLAEQVRGRAFGFELLARRDLTKRVTGWISYTLSRSTRQTHGLIAPTPNSLGVPTSSATLQDIPSEFDRTHILNAVGALDLGAGWRAGLRFVFYTGRPYSPEIRGIPVPPFNSLRLPPFYRVDVRLEKRWRAFGQGYVSFVLEGLNVTLNKEAIDVTCSHSTSLSSPYDACSPQYIGPIAAPSLGVEAGF